MYVLGFIGIGFVLQPEATLETLMIRSLSTAAFILLHVILSIGPLCRLNAKFLPWLYNRRHMGVSMFLLALGHGLLSLVQFHGFGDVSPLVSLFTSNMHYDSLVQFPFQVLGFFALIILFMMAATSHDFWLNHLTAPIWKALHMGVYVAYALIVMHVLLGVLQTETHIGYVILLVFGFVWIAILHLLSAIKERSIDIKKSSLEKNGYINVGSIHDIQEGRGITVSIGGERVAVYKYEGKISALSNVCQHQNGPLGEGR